MDMDNQETKGEPLSFFPKGTDGPCPHTGGDDVIKMATSALEELNLSEEDWNGYGAVFVENLPNYMWKSIKTVVQYEKGKWVIKEIDRREKLSAESELGFTLRSPK